MDDDGGPKAMFRDEELCRHLLDRIETAWSLRIGASAMLGAGAGLFAGQDIGEGQQVFASRPLATSVAEGLTTVCCDWCLADAGGKVHPSGRFRTGRDQILALSVCERCGVCGYCSEGCRARAWEGYHRYECVILQEMPALSARARALCRILVQRAHGRITTVEWRALRSLPTHYAERLAKAGSDDLEAMASVVRARTGTDLQLSHIVELHCTLLTNMVCIRHAGQSHSLGLSLDVPMALMNHSCDPNVHTIFEGNELRVRSLRPVRAGEELLQCYADYTCDVLTRRKKLRDDFFFTCTCYRCEQEHESHMRWADGDLSKVRLLQHIQETFTGCVNAAVRKMAVAPDGQIPVDVVTESKALTSKAYPDGSWPNSLNPMPMLWKRLGNMHSLLGDHITALRHSVRGCAYTEHRRGPEWINDVHDLIKILVAAVVQDSQSEDGDGRGDDEAPRRATPFSLDSGSFWDAYRGYLALLLRLADTTFGTSALFSRAVRRWHRDVFAADGLGLPAGFEDAHLSLLVWAGVDADQWALESVAEVV